MQPNPKATTIRVWGGGRLAFKNKFARHPTIDRMAQKNPNYTPAPISVLEMISAANSVEKLQALIELADGYHKASEKTKKKWMAAIFARKAILENVDEEGIPK